MTMNRGTVKTIKLIVTGFIECIIVYQSGQASGQCPGELVHIHFPLQAGSNVSSLCFSGKV